MPYFFNLTRLGIDIMLYLIVFFGGIKMQLSYTVRKNRFFL